MNTRIGRLAHNFSSKVPCFVLLTKPRFKQHNHSRMSIQTGVDSMSSTEAGCPASKLTKTDQVMRLVKPATKQGGLGLGLQVIT